MVGYDVHPLDLDGREIDSPQASHCHRQRVDVADEEAPVRRVELLGLHRRVVRTAVTLDVLLLQRLDERRGDGRVIGLLTQFEVTHGRKWSHPSAVGAGPSTNTTPDPVTTRPTCANGTGSGRSASSATARRARSEGRVAANAWSSPPFATQDKGSAPTSNAASTNSAGKGRSSRASSIPTPDAWAR